MKGVNAFNKLPYDCLCDITGYFRDAKDYNMFIMISKDTRVIAKRSWSAPNVQFCCIKMPEHVLNYVNKLCVLDKTLTFDKFPNCTFIYFRNRRTKGLNNLSEYIKWSTTLTTLYLSVEYIGGVEAKCFVEALKVNKTLTTFYLWDNAISRDVITPLANAIKENTTFTEWNSSSNGIETTDYYAEALKINSNLPKSDDKWNYLKAFKILLNANNKLKVYLRKLQKNYAT